MENRKGKDQAMLDCLYFLSNALPVNLGYSPVNEREIPDLNEVK